jgi:phosphatidylserine/phosphatidylglycerophosphate/cardiolipin synthase-like enzyme
VKDGPIRMVVVDAECPEVYVQGLVRKRATHWVVTLFLVNGQEEPKIKKDETFLFQPKMIVEGTDEAAIFQRKSPGYGLTDDLERATMEMLYRHEVEFAVGHGVGVHAEVSEESPERAVRVRTKVVPAHEVPMTTPPTAADAEQWHRKSQSVELVWTGPEVEGLPFRRTEQAILQVLDSATQRITLVSYAIYHIPRVREALVRAARRGVRLCVVLETPNCLEGQGEYDTLQALGADVANCATVYYWPEDQRRRDSEGKLGILHVKCAVADGRSLFLSSANLTEYAFTINMELGLLVTGGPLPGQVEEQFERLIGTGVLAKI